MDGCLTAPNPPVPNSAAGHAFCNAPIVAMTAVFADESPLATARKEGWQCTDMNSGTTRAARHNTVVEP
jgi:hypothetical protein